MKLLILGGTQFVGRHIVRAALAAGHELTLFNRGKSGAGLFPEVETLLGDREGSLEALQGRTWDAVIDVSGYMPGPVQASARLLADAVERYVYISTVMVYADYSIPGQDESAPRAGLTATPLGDGPAYAYALQKAQCERVLETVLPDRLLTIRPGFIVGPNDYSDRFASWARRIRQGGEMLAPGGPSFPLQFIDGRDLAAFTLRMVEARQATAYNVAGPAERFSWGDLFDRCRRCLGVDTRFTWVNDAFLEAHGLANWVLPLWVPPTDRGLMACDCRRAVAAGLTFRPFEETFRDTLQWGGAAGTTEAGLAPEREAALLRAWHTPVAGVKRRGRKS